MAQETVTTCDSCGEPINVDSEPHFVLNAYAAFTTEPYTSKNEHYHIEHWPEEYAAMRPEGVVNV